MSWPEFLKGFPWYKGKAIIPCALIQNTCAFQGRDLSLYRLCWSWSVLKPGILRLEDFRIREEYPVEARTGETGKQILEHNRADAEAENFLNILAGHKQKNLITNIFLARRTDSCIPSLPKRKDTFSFFRWLCRKTKDDQRKGSLDFSGPASRVLEKKAVLEINFMRNTR